MAGKPPAAGSGGDRDDRKFAIYSRKSKFTGKGESVENQVALAKEYLMRHYPESGALEIEVYEDEGYSGGNLDRPQFAKMMDAARGGGIRAVICYRLDRISRNIGDFSKLIDELSCLRVDFISVTEQFDTSSPMGKAMMYIASVFSQLERETIAERIRDNLHELSKTGRWLGGVTPTGFASECVERVAVDGKVRTACKLKPIPGEIRLVELIFDLMAEKGSLTKTETYLLNHRYKTKNGKDFTRFAIKNILSNPVYLVADADAYRYFEENGAQIFAGPEEFDGTHGVMVYNRTNQAPHQAAKINPMEEWVVSVGKHEGVIPSARWLYVQKMLAENRDRGGAGRRAGRVNGALLSGLLRCACGDYMRPKLQDRRNGDGERVYYYVCSMKERSRGARCGAKPVDGNCLDRWVCSALRELPVDGGEWRNRMRKSRAYFKDNRSKLETDTERIRAALGENRREIQGLVAALARASGTPAEDYVVRQIEELDGRAAELKARLAELEAENQDCFMTEAQFALAEELLSSPGKTFDAMSVERKRAAVRAAVERAVWDGEDVHLYLFGGGEGCGAAFPAEARRPETVTDHSRHDRIANEILMHFRSQRKLQGEVSLSDSLDGDGEGNSLSLMDVISVDDDMLDNLDARDACLKVRKCVQSCLSDREAMIINLRYGLGGRNPLTQREIAAQCGISRSYVSHRAYCKRRPESLDTTGFVRALFCFSSAALIVSAVKINKNIGGHSSI